MEYPHQSLDTMVADDPGLTTVPGGQSDGYTNFRAA